MSNLKQKNLTNKYEKQDITNTVVLPTNHAFNDIFILFC